MGFKKICHNLIFQFQTRPKGEKLVEAEEYRENGVSFLSKL